MAKKKKDLEKAMSITDAVKNLSSMAELDVQEDNKPSEKKSVKSELQSFEKLQEKERERTLNIVKGTFKTIHNYLRHVYKKEQKDLKDSEVQKGVRSIMVLAGEAADKLDQCTTIFKHTYNEGAITEIKEYQELKDFYLNKIVARFKKALASEEAWEEEWGIEDIHMNIAKLGLKDLETVKRDRKYELFYIRQEDGKPFFNRNLLRHIKLVSDFDQIVGEVEGKDPLLTINIIIEKETQSVAEGIKNKIKNEMADYLFYTAENKDLEIVKMINGLITSLVLAANSNNLVKDKVGKTCRVYFQDCHQFLRKILSSKEYKLLNGHSLEELDHLSQSLVLLIGSFSYALITQISKWERWQVFIYELCRENKPVHSKGTLNLFNSLLESYDSMQEFLDNYPSGPLFKTLDTFKIRGEDEGFDPFMQGNCSQFIYSFSCKALYTQCLRIPCPTFHAHINQVHIIDEFKSYLTFLRQKKENKKYLMINLQDLMSWEEHARCKALEEVQKKADYSKQFVLVTFPKKGDFYNQSDMYLETSDSKEFFKLIEDQISGGEECGFYYSYQIKLEEIKAFTKKILPVVHKHFFEGKKNLSRKERLDFIELFYLFFSLKIIEWTRPDYFSFTCKDGVDTGATMGAGFYTLVKLLSADQTWSDKETKYLVWLIFGPAFKVRERLVNNHILNRAVSALSCLAVALERDQKPIIKSLVSLYDFRLFQNTELSDTP